MMFWGMMIAGVVGTIENTLAPKILELALCVETFKPMNAYLDALGVIIPIVRPWVVMLPVVMGVEVGWKWPSFLRVV